MKRFSIVLTAAFFALSAPADSSAQVGGIFIGGGVTIPTGDYSDFGGGDGANTGWQGMAGAQFAIGESPVTAGPRVFYGSNNHETTGDKTNLYGATALVSYNLGEAGAVNPFLFGEFGVMSHAYKSDTATEDTATAAAWGGGVGVDFPLGGVSGWVVAAYHAGLGDNEDTTLFGIYAGVSVPIGG